MRPGFGFGHVLSDCSLAPGRVAAPESDNAKAPGLLRLCLFCVHLAASLHPHGANRQRKSLPKTTDAAFRTGTDDDIRIFRQTKALTICGRSSILAGKMINKIIRIGSVLAPGKQFLRHDVFCKVRIEEGKLSITGVIGPTKDGNAAGGSGQIDMEFAHRNPADNDRRYSMPIMPSQIQFAPGWTGDRWLDFLDIWHNWHLNDTCAACEHQTGPAWDARKQLEVVPLTWGDEYHRLRKAAEAGEMDRQQYVSWQEVVKAVESLTIAGLRNHTPKHPALWGERGEDFIKRGLVKVERTQTTGAGWVYPQEHPEGLLCKPCPVCGHKYGSRWLFKPLPPAVVQFLGSLPDADKSPAWV